MDVPPPPHPSPNFVTPMDTEDIDHNLFSHYKLHTYSIINRLMKGHQTILQES